jgi:AAA ATPase domain/Adenylate and Guanylate cyclase catalytic domain
VEIRVGLNSGEVVVRSIGSDLRMDYIAGGQTTHLAAGMEQVADPSSILLTPQTLQLAEGYIEVNPRGPLVVKGLPAPVSPFELVGVSSGRTRWQRRAARGVTRFVGRQVELVRLVEARARVQAGQGQVVAIIGDPGIGKSRLVWEFTRSYYAGGLILETGCVPYGIATPWLPVVELLTDYVGVDDRDDVATVRDKLAGRLRAVDAELLPLSSALLALLDVAASDPAWAALDAVGRRQRTLEAVKRLVFRASRDRPTVLVVEDFQWIDSASQALLDSLVDDLSSSRLLLLVPAGVSAQVGVAGPLLRAAGRVARAAKRR